MRYRTLLRSSAALRMAQGGLLLPPRFWFARTPGFGDHTYGWVPSVITMAEDGPVSAVSYALTAGLAVWEAGRLREAGIWRMTAVRSRYRVAAEILLPVVLLAWLAHLVMVAVVLVQSGVWPDAAGLRTLVIPLLACPAWAVIGFAVGCRVWRVAAAPVLAMVTWVVTAMAWSLTTPWPRKMSGIYPETLGFGQIATLPSLVPHIICVGGVAVGLALLWLRLPPPARAALAAAVALAGPLGAYAMVHGGRSTDEPVISGRAPMTCAGRAPSVCVPEFAASALPAARSQTLAMLGRLHALGIGVHPRVVADDLPHGVHGTPLTLRVQLRTASATHSVRYGVVRAASALPCEQPAHADLAMQARLWVPEGTGQRAAYLAAARDDWDAPPQTWPIAVARAAAVVRRVHTLPAARQAAWWRGTARAACEAGSS